MRPLNSRLIAVCLTATLGFTVAGCHRDDVTVLQVPKGAQSPTALPPSGSDAQDTAAMGGGTATPPAGHAAVRADIKYKLPEGWKEVPPSGMSVAGFSMADDKAQLSVMSFPSAAISQLEMVNIVRQRSNLPPIDATEMAKMVESVDVGGEKGSYVDFSSATQSGSDTNGSSSKLGLTIAIHGGATWFFKFTGESATIAAQKPALLEFLKSVQFPAASSATAALPAGHPSIGNSGAAPGGLPQMGSDAPANPADAANKPQWDVPKNWVEKPPTQMLLAKFNVQNSGASADVTVSSFPGSVGGLLANVNRWRGNVSLDPIAEDDLSKSTSSIDVPGGKAVLVDVSGKSAKTGNDARLIGVIWPRGDQTWFYKFLGDPAVVDHEKDAFQKFVQSVRY